MNNMIRLKDNTVDPAWQQDAWQIPPLELLNRIPVMISYWNSSERNCFANHAFLTWFGITIEQITSMHLRDVIGDLCYQLSSEHVKAALRGKAQKFEKILVLPEGNQFQRMLVEYIPDVIGAEVIGFYAQFTNISHLSKIEPTPSESEEKRRASVSAPDGTLTHYVSRPTDSSERKNAEAEIKYMTCYDQLTQLPNRRLLTDRLQQALVSSKRSGNLGALLLIDLDHFKMLNDTMGHDIGDLLLLQVADRLRTCVREKDSIARFGGDEFVIMLEDLSCYITEAAAEAKNIGEKILLALNQPYQLGNYSCHSTPSIGAVVFKNNLQSIDELFKQADIAMYQSKDAGRNTLRFFDQKIQDGIDTHVKLEGELRQALKKQEFELYFQVQVNSAGQAEGAEALIRWIHPERGLIPPFQFIPIAEENGMIVPIGQWVLEAACAQLNTWQQSDATRELVLAVNVSARQFHQANFVSQLQAIAARYSIIPARLKIELTESMLVHDIENIILKINELKNDGFQFSLDDFGTGYSSLQYLKRLPIDQLKIDQSFVRDLITDTNDQAIVRTIIVMSTSMELDVIAEGVETEAQRQALLSRGCTHYQGYLFGKPVPIQQFEALVNTLNTGSLEYTS